MTSRFVNQEAAGRSGEHVDFSFGENWRKFLDSLTEERTAQARASLAASFGGASLAGHTFVDLGCGSGLFSRVALDLGAARVISVDIDPASVACAEALRASSARPDDWVVLRGSVLDAGVVRALTPATRVYSWGVLHHTGAMWNAIANLLGVLAPGGLACLGLYNRPHFAAAQMALKRTYNGLPAPFRPVLACAYAGALLAAVGLTGRNPVRYVREYGRRERGMRFWRDVVDWLGGLPFEFVEEPSMRRFVAERGLSLERVVRRRPGGNNEYLIRRPG